MAAVAAKVIKPIGKFAAKQGSRIAKNISRSLRSKSKLGTSLSKRLGTTNKNVTPIKNAVQTTEAIPTATAVPPTTTGTVSTVEAVPMTNTGAVQTAEAVPVATAVSATTGAQTQAQGTPGQADDTDRMIEYYQNKAIEQKDRFLSAIQHEKVPDQTAELDQSINELLNNLKMVLSQTESRRCLVKGFAELIDKTSSDFVYYMNEALIEVAMEDPNIQLMIRSLIQDMIAEIINDLTPEERDQIINNLNGDCRVAFQYVS